MKLVIMKPVFAGARGYIPGPDEVDIHPLIAEEWLRKGLARVAGSAAPVEAVAPIAPEATASVRIEERVAELRKDYTVAELRKMYEAATGERPNRGMHEEDLAIGIAASER